MVKDIRHFIDKLKIKDKNNFQLLNSICINVEKCFGQFIKQKIESEHYRGIIFCCRRGFFPRYSRDLKGIFSAIEYNTFEQSIPKSDEKNISNAKKIQDFLIERIKADLPKDIQKTKNQRIKAAISTGLASGEGELIATTGETFENPRNLIGLIEICLNHYTQNLNIVINNAEDFNWTDFESSINDIFAAGKTKDRFAALTLVCSFSHNFIEFIKTGIWFEFSPENKIKEKDFINCIWRRLDYSQQKAFSCGITSIEKILIDSKGSTGMIREKWKMLFP